MNDHTQSRMSEATRLTQEGRLDEAMAVIRGALGGPSATIGNPPTTDAPIDVTSRLVREARQGAGPSRNPRSGGVRDLLGNLAGGAPGKNAGASVSVPEGAQFLERSYSNGAGSRSYKLYVPSGRTGGAGAYLPPRLRVGDGG